MSVSEKHCSHKLCGNPLNHWSFNRLLPPVQIYIPVTASFLTDTEEVFKRLLPQWAKFTQRGQRKTQNHVKFSWKFQWKYCSTTHLHFLSSKETGQQKRKKWEEWEREIKVNGAVWFFNPRDPEMLLSVHPRTSKADISHLEQNAMKCSGIWQIDR